MLKCSGDGVVLSDKHLDEIREVFESLSGQMVCCLVVEEYAVGKGRHVHFGCILNEEFIGGLTAPRNMRTKLRELLKSRLDVPFTVVDPEKGNNSWEKMKRYLCKGYTSKKDDDVRVVMKHGLEFATDGQIGQYQAMYHRKFTEEERQSRHVNKMDLLKAELQKLKDKKHGVVVANDILEMVYHTYKREGWLIQKHYLCAQVRTLYASVHTDDQEAQVLNMYRDELRDIM